MGKTLVYVALLGILGLGVYYFFFKDSDNLYQGKEANFTFRDTSVIGKIFLVENDGTSILLERGDDNKWILNKQYPAMPLQMVNILTCLKLQTAFSPVSDRDFDRVVKLLAGLSTKVEVYNRQGEKMRSFYVAGQGPNYHGSYMILENAKQPYLVDIPGFDGYLTPRYTTLLNDWRTRTLIELKSSDIATIEIQYPDNPSNSFKVDNTSKVPQVVRTAITDNAGELNVKRVLSYLDLFKMVNAEGYLNGANGMDTVIAQAKMRCKMIVKSKAGEQVALDIYWMPGDEKAQALEAPNGVPEEVERMYVVNPIAKDTLLIQGRTFDKLIQKGSVFYQ
jgi:hypothetical protein